MLRFDDILADAQEQGRLQNYEHPFPEELTTKLKLVLHTEVPVEKMQMPMRYVLKRAIEDYVQATRFIIALLP